MMNRQSVPVAARALNLEKGAKNSAAVAALPQNQFWKWDAIVDHRRQQLNRNCLSCANGAGIEAGFIHLLPACFWDMDRLTRAISSICS